jgi:AcrR family transcriptional regulator
VPRTSDSPTSTERPARPDANGTRERILDIALDLFVEKGYDKTSLREIAEELGFSKAALYYHFASKDDILMALHLRLHQLGETAFTRLDAAPVTPTGWGALLQEVIGTMLANRKLLILHERNRGALEEIGTRHPHPEHDHNDFEAAFRRVMGDEAIPIRDRIRMVGALGSIVGGLLVYTTSFNDTPVDEYASLLREMVADLLPSA